MQAHAYKTVQGFNEHKPVKMNSETRRQRIETVQYHTQLRSPDVRLKEMQDRILKKVNNRVDML